MSNMTNVMNVLFPAKRQRVLAALLLQPAASFHLRELARLAGSNAGTLAREVEKLTLTGLILRSQQGNQVRYQANTRHSLFTDLAALFRKTHGVVPALRDALAPLEARIVLAFVFGSIARGTESVGSDVDVLILGSAGFAEVAQALYPLHEQLGREVNPVLYAPAEFVARLVAGDAFACELMGKPKLWIKGGDDELVELAGHRAPAGSPA
jgi:predicted nucleotidyltransferase